ncbi:MAG: HTH domain-containing protein [Lachnospiraceae bacterium]|nr:HTH domain-containing protein [Lachnospiraceae bacterium]
MSSIELLDKTRRLNSLLQEMTGDRVVFDDICSTMGSIVPSSVCVLSAKGKIIGKDRSARYPRIFSSAVGSFIDDSLNKRLLSVLSTKENVRLDTLGVEDRGVMETEVLITPVMMGGDRIGTLLFFRRNRGFSVEDIILCEYASTVVSLEMYRSLEEEEASEERLRSDIKGAVSTLSPTERQAVQLVLDRLSSDGGLIVASKLSAETGITRSVIVNAIKKLESAGVVSSRSAGVKGTYIKILNFELFEELEAIQ